MVDAALAERLTPSVGLRNVLAHEYTSTDLGVVAASVPLALEHYRDYVRQVADTLSRS